MVKNEFSLGNSFLFQNCLQFLGNGYMAEWTEILGHSDSGL